MGSGKLLSKVKENQRSSRSISWGEQVTRATTVKCQSKRPFSRLLLCILLINGAGRVLAVVVVAVLAAAVGLGAGAALVVVPLTVGLAAVRVVDVVAVGFGLMSPLVVAAAF